MNAAARLALGLARWTARVAGAALLAAAVFLSGMWLHLRGSLPEYAGTVQVAGLKGGVDIVRDGNGVPHIFAGSLEDAMFGLGYAHAQDRLWQMEVMRRVAAGRLSEIVPPRLAGGFLLNADRTMRGLGVQRAARDSLAALSPRTRGVLDAYSAGVNTWIAGHKGSFGPEFTLLGVEPERWTPVDSMVWGKLMALSLDGNWRAELMRLRLVRAVGEERMRHMFEPSGEGKDSTLSLLGEALLRLPLDRIFEGTASPFVEKLTASNEWVVDGRRSATGKPILANDPHLGLSAPGTWYLARIVVPGLDIRGATAPGSPGVVLGHNGRIAWGFTTANLDSQDLFVEKIDPTDPGRYVTPEGSRPFGVREEEIRVRWGEPVRLRVRETRHGPVISDFVDKTGDLAGAGHVLALTAVALDRADTSPEGFFEIGLARDWEEFLGAARRILGPMQNIVYADVEGNIGFVSPARVPLRRKGDGFLPAPGWTGEFDWAGSVPFEELPRAFNPPGGMIVNANAAVAPPDYRHFLSRDWAEPYRQRRAAQLLRAADKHDVAGMVAIQADNFSPDAAEMLPLLLAVPPRNERASRAIAMLGRWNWRMLADRPEPLVYAAWLRELHRALYADELGPELFRDVASPAVAFPLAILRSHPDWCDDIKTARAETCADAIAAALDAALDMLSARHGPAMEAWRWGEAHQAAHRHLLFDPVPLLRRLASARYPADGGMHTLNRAVPAFRDAAEPFAAVHGAGLRAIYDLADPDASRFAIAIGQSGNMLSPWYRNFVDDWIAFRYVRIAGPRFAVERAGIGTVSLRPR